MQLHIQSFSLEVIPAQQVETVATAVSDRYQRDRVTSVEIIFVLVR